MVTVPKDILPWGVNSNRPAERERGAGYVLRVGVVPCVSALLVRTTSLTTIADTCMPDLHEPSADSDLAVVGEKDKSCNKQY
jgi:hypothetical protein